MWHTLILVLLVMAVSGCVDSDGLTGNAAPTYAEKVTTDADTATGPWEVAAAMTLPAGTESMRGEWAPDFYSGTWTVWLAGPNGERVNGPCGESMCGPSVGNTGQFALRADKLTPGQWTMHAAGEGTGDVEVRLIASVPVA